MIKVVIIVYYSQKTFYDLVTKLQVDLSRFIFEGYLSKPIIGSRIVDVTWNYSMKLNRCITEARGFKKPDHVKIAYAKLVGGSFLSFLLFK